MEFLLIVLLVLAIAAAIFVMIDSRRNIEGNGLETQGIISGIADNVNDGSYVYRVKYKDQNGFYRESLVKTDQDKYEIDDKVVIKYIPGSFKYAFLVSNLSKKQEAD